jgi:hypothetical protein
MASGILNMGKPAITTELQKYIDDSKAAITAIDATTEPDRNLSADYGVLIDDLTAVVNTEASTDITVYTSKLVELKGRYDALNTRKVQFMASASPSVYTLTDLAQLTYGTALDTVLLFVITTAIILGGTIMSHVFIEESLPYRLYYFVYGAALFPFSIIYGIFYTPFWRSTIFPWVLKGEESSSMSRFPASVFWNLIAYSAPSPLDKETLGNTKGMLRMFSIGVLLSFIVSYFLVYEKLPI